MKRPVGVTLSALVAMAGSVLALLSAAVFVAVVASGAPEVRGIEGFAYVMAATLLAFGVFGIVVAIGLLNLRPWARSAAMILAGFMVVFSLSSLVVIAFIQLPAQPGLSPGALRSAMVTVYAVPLLVGVWWLVQFNRAQTKAAFAGESPSEEPERPLAISLIGWFNILGGVFVLALAMNRAPAMAAGFTLTGWSATLFYVFVGGVNTFLGWRLLQLDERARILTIWWFVLTIAHTTYMALSPGARERLIAMQVAMQPPGAQTRTIPFEGTAFTVGLMLASAAILAAAIWPLVTRRSAFHTH